MENDNLLSSIKNTHKENNLLVKDSKKGSIFCIKHTPRDIVYNINGFIMKNRDELSVDLIDVLLRSKNKTINQIIVCDGSDDRDTNSKNNTNNN